MKSTRKHPPPKPPGQPLSEYTWAEIAAISKSGLASTYWTIGTPDAVKDVEIGGETVPVEIVGYDHDDLADGSGKAGITFGTVNCRATTVNMNASATNSGGWGSCVLRSTINANNGAWALPTDLDDVIKTVYKKSSHGAGSTAIDTVEDKLWLFAEIEVFGVATNSVSGEGDHYSERFTTAANRIKNVGTVANTWWTRSPRVTGVTNGFTRVDASGLIDSGGNASLFFGVCFGFCV